jgi:hypothetical protein
MHALIKDAHPSLQTQVQVDRENEEKIMVPDYRATNKDDTLREKGSANQVKKAVLQLLILCTAKELTVHREKKAVQIS